MPSIWSACGTLTISPLTEIERRDCRRELFNDGVVVEPLGQREVEAHAGDVPIDAGIDPMKTLGGWPPVIRLIRLMLEPVSWGMAISVQV